MIESFALLVPHDLIWLKLGVLFLFVFFCTDGQFLMISDGLSHLVRLFLLAPRRRWPYCHPLAVGGGPPGEDREEGLDTEL